VDWIEQQWEAARLEVANAGKSGVVLVLDEIQKIPYWSESVKRLWDEDTPSGIALSQPLGDLSRQAFPGAGGAATCTATNRPGATAGLLP
jgi:hypothetical protein